MVLVAKNFFRILDPVARFLVRIIRGGCSRRETPPFRPVSRAPPASRAPPLVQRTAVDPRCSIIMKTNRSQPSEEKKTNGKPFATYSDSTSRIIHPILHFSSVQGFSIDTTSTNRDAACYVSVHPLPRPVPRCFRLKLYFSIQHRLPED